MIRTDRFTRGWDAEVAEASQDQRQRTFFIRDRSNGRRSSEQPWDIWWQRPRLMLGGNQRKRRRCRRDKGDKGEEEDKGTRQDRGHGKKVRNTLVRENSALAGACACSCASCGCMEGVQRGQRSSAIWQRAIGTKARFAERITGIGPNSAH